MTKLLSRFAMITLMLSVNYLTAKAEDFSCPAQISTKQSLAQTQNGYEQFIDTVNERHVWTGVSLYDGPPADLAELVPDNESAETPPYWTLSPSENPRPFYLVCRYSDTYVRLAKKLPPEIRKCSTTYDKPKHSREFDSVITSVNCSK